MKYCWARILVDYLSFLLFVPIVFLFGVRGLICVRIGFIPEYLKNVYKELLKRTRCITGSLRI